MPLRQELPPDVLIPEEPVWARWPMLLAASALLVGGLVLLVSWREVRQEREFKRLLAEQARLRAQLGEASARRTLLGELERLASGSEFYVVIHGERQEGHLRLHDRTIRRFAWGNPGVVFPSGLYHLETKKADRLDWKSVVLVTRTSAELCSFPSEAGSCLIVSSSDLAALRRTLKPGASLALLP